MSGASFLFAVCQIDAEKVLKEELAREHPGFHLAFSRPGFLTFKASSIGTGAAQSTALAAKTAASTASSGMVGGC